MSKSGGAKRLLCIVGGMNAGGAETFLMKVYRVLDKSKYQMDFYVAIQEEGFYDNEILSMGGRIFHSIPKSRGFYESFRALRNTIKNEKYEYVMRVSQHSLSTIDLLAAKLGGAKVLIYRSSNSDTGGSDINKMLHKLFKWLPRTVPSIKIAPSTEAAEFMFGKKCVSTGKAIIVKNALEVEKFVFNKEKREKIRREFKIEDKFVVGHVGRFNNQKNHSFLLDIFNEILKKNNNSILLLVGKGEQEGDIVNKIKSLGLEDKVILTGVRSDVANIMMAMDVFVFPSFFEGMPNTVIEAQATGLQTIISDTITKEAKITDRVMYLSLNLSAKNWADKILEFKGNYERNNIESLFAENMYDIKVLVEKIQKIIFVDERRREN